MRNMAIMKPDTYVIASGNLATSQRTINGLLGQLALLAIDRKRALAMFTDAGLPPRALEEPDFPISLEQELVVCLALARSLPEGRSAVCLFFEAMPQLGIENLGVLGMAMRHAATAVEALRTCLTYPQLTWGHSRMTVRREGESALFSFSMERPLLRDASEEDIDRLVEYCLALDLLSSLRNMEDIADARDGPLYITFPFPEPEDWTGLSSRPACPVTFAQPEARLAFPTALDDTPLPRANPLVYRSYVSIAEKLSQLLAEEFSLVDRVTRWLWAYTPPPSRRQIADLLAMSERNLTRQLAREGTSYAQLLARVQEERAKNFLRNPALSVTEIADRLGYAEPAAFSRAFSRWAGMSPLKWRRQQASPARRDDRSHQL